MSNPSTPDPEGRAHPSGRAGRDPENTPRGPGCGCAAPPGGRGTLVLVVGPSGAGKDTLIDGARDRLGACGRFRFPSRVITRLAEAGGEDHEAVTPETFEAMAAAGEFCLTWRAHDLSYAIPAKICAPLAAGQHVIANVSRSVIDAARKRFDPLAVILVTASRETLAHRLALRGRETPEDIAERLARRSDTPMTGPDIHVVENEGDIGAGVEAFLAVLHGLAAHCAALGSARPRLGH